MKKVLMIALFAVSIQICAQFQFETANIGETTTPISAIGIGQFTSPLNFAARLHINNFYCNSATGSLNGLLFRADGDQSVSNFWQMYTGASAAAQTKRFEIEVLPNSYNVNINNNDGGIGTGEAEIQLRTAEIRLQARGKRLGDFCEINGAADEVIIGDGSDVNFTALSGSGKRLFYHGSDGFLGLGDGFSETGLNPNYNLHIHELDPIPSFAQWTNDSTGAEPTDGLIVGVSETFSDIRSFDTDRWLRLGQNDRVRMVFRNIPGDPDYNGLNGSAYSGVSRIMVPLRQEDSAHTPISMMQLGTRADGALERNWMNVGTTYGANQDALYVGLMERANPDGGNLQTDAILAWGCQLGGGDSISQPEADNFRIVFLQPENLLLGVERSNQGKEVLRIEPLNGNVGIGNYSQSSNKPPGTPGYVDAKLDIDGDLRIRGLEMNDTLNMVLVADSSDLNRVYWRPVSSIAAEACEWNESTNGTSNDLVMGYVGACNEGNVGIGDDNPDAKLVVKENYSGVSGTQYGERINVLGSLDDSYGLHVTMGNGVLGAATRTYGVYAESQGSPDKNYGGYFVGTNGSIANSTSTGCLGAATSSNSSGTDLNFGIQGVAGNARRNTGVYGDASGAETSTQLNTGVSGSASTSPNSIASTGVLGSAWATYANSGSPVDVVGVKGAVKPIGAALQTTCGYDFIGVWGQAPSYSCESTTGALSLAGYFSGDVIVTGSLTHMGALISSDENLKSDIEDLSSTIERVMQLNPRTYTWNQSATNALNLPEGQDYGFIAQEVQELFPDLVKSFSTKPEYDDETGEVVYAREEWKGIKYNAFFPILTKAIQEQQAIIEEQQASIEEQNNKLSAFEEALQNQQAQLDALSLELAACCAVAPDQRSGAVQDDIRLEALPGQDRLDQNTPNPFTENTSLRFSLGAEKHARVCIYNSRGQLIDCLVDDTRAAGNHRVDWNTSNLASGIYFYSLEVDGFEQVRRAVKL